MQPVAAKAADPSLRILLIEDNDGDALLVREALEEYSPDAFTLTHKTSLENAAMAFSAEIYDILLLDLSLPGVSGMDAVERARQERPDMPIIVLTGTDDESRAIGALERGVQDYLVKGCYGNEILPRSIRYGIERKRFERRVIELAYFDSLTGLINRDAFLTRLRSAIAVAGDNCKPLAVFVIDLSRFKDVNDSHGREAGDALLKQVAVRLKECLGHEDALARMSGDEFVLFIDGPRAAAENLPGFSHRLLKHMSHPFLLGDTELKVGCRIGIASYPSCGEDEDVLIKHAEIALNRARKAGSNHFQLYTRKLNEELQERLKMESELQEALKEGTLVPHYQPLIDLATNRVCGVETLLRWFHPTRGSVPPALFIPVAESSGLILEISDYVLTRACEDYREWKNLIRQPFHLGINISAQELQRRHFADRLSKVLSAANISFRQMALEVTESTLMLDAKQAAETLNECRDLGSAILVDDFGTGYSSLSYLSVLPLDTLKIDRSFISDILTNAHNRLIATSTIHLAKGLGLSVIAEGIETRAQRELLMELGCDVGQGYYFAKPMGKENLKEWLGAYPLAA